MEHLGWALLAQMIWLGLAVLGALLRGGSTARHLGLVPSRWGAGRVASLSVGFLCLSVALDLVLRSLDLRDVGQLGGLDQWIRESRSLPGALLVLVVLPAVGEELLFRGLIQRFLHERLGALASVVVAAAAFGAAHGDPVHATAAFAMGLYLGVIAALTGSVWPAVLAHGCNNTVAVGSVWLGIESPPGGLLAAGALVLAALTLLGELARRKRREAGVPEGRTLQRGQ